MRRKIVFLVLDGLGEGQENISNPFRFAKIKNFTYFKKNYPFTLLVSSGISVGLPANESGNCEMGHLSLGCGIVYYQNYPRIALEIEKGTFFENEKLKSIFDHCRQFNSRLHLVGLLSEGINKSSFDHILALLELAKRQNFQKVYLHLFTDGVDSSLRSAVSLLTRLKNEIEIKKYSATIASLCGRFYALDETGNYLLRTQKTFLLLVEGLGVLGDEPISFLKNKYQDESFNDSLLEPVIFDKDGIVKDNDALLFFNFENKSIFQLANAFLNPEFKEFNRPERKNLYLSSLTRYLDNIDYPVIFEAQKIYTNLSKVLAENHLKQLKLIDTTRENILKFYFNGFFTEEHAGEIYKVFPPFEKTFEKIIESSKEMLDALRLVIQDGSFDFVLVNLPTFDFIGHMGNFQLAVKAIEFVDDYFGLFSEILEKKDDIVLIITSDHGNIERMIDPLTGHKDINHTTNPVPFFLIDPSKKKEKTKMELNFYSKKILGSLIDVAPTILELLNLKIPKEFEGKSLLRYF